MTNVIHATERRTTVKSRSRGLIAKVGAIAMAAGVLALFAAPAAMATETAPATITKPDGVTPLNSGGSATDWTIALPVGAHCTGDTATGGYLVYSYITSADPSTLTFSGTGPSSGEELLTTGGTPYGAQSTAITTGAIAQTPTLNYQFFNVNGAGGDYELTPGTYNLGIACATKTGALDQYWNVQEVFTANGSDPNGETWSVVPATQVPESPLAVALPIGALLILGAGFVVARRRRRSTDPVSPA
jgi:hypothetical protein